MPDRVRKDLEDVVRWSADPPGYGNRLVVVAGHGAVPPWTVY